MLAVSTRVIVSMIADTKSSAWYVRGTKQSGAKYY